MSHAYALYYSSIEGSSHSGAEVLGIFTSLEAAMTEGERYNKRTKEPLAWTACVTDHSPKTAEYWFARLTTWKMPTQICIQRKTIDGKAFRP